MSDNQRLAQHLADQCFTLACAAVRREHFDEATRWADAGKTAIALLRQIEACERERQVEFFSAHDIEAVVARAHCGSKCLHIVSNGGVGWMLTLERMRSVAADVMRACGKLPDLVVCHPMVHETYGNLLGEDCTYVREFAAPNGRLRRFEQAYKFSLYYTPIPVVACESCDQDAMLFVNLQHLDDPAHCGRLEDLVPA